MNKTRSKILVVSMILTFVVIRSYLHIYPNADLDVFGYNIHHLYSGFLLVLISSIPLVLCPLSKRISNLATIVFGIGLSLVLDEWIYLIVTDGSNSSYLLPISFWGGAIFTLLTCIYILILYFIFAKHDKN